MSFVRLLVVSAALAAGGCSSYSHISGQGFAEKVRFQSETMRDDQFIGCAGNRAYLCEWRYWPIFGDRHSVYWTRIADLPPEDQDKLYRAEEPYVSRTPKRNLNGY